MGLWKVTSIDSFVLSYPTNLCISDVRNIPYKSGVTCVDVFFKISYLLWGFGVLISTWWSVPISLIRKAFVSVEVECELHLLVLGCYWILVGRPVAWFVKSNSGRVVDDRVSLTPYWLPFNVPLHARPHRCFYQGRFVLEQKAAQMLRKSCCTDWANARNYCERPSFLYRILVQNIKEAIGKTERLWEITARGHHFCIEF